jgi:phosphate:Na+ symporter
LALVVGANLDSAINPLLEGGQGNNPASRRVPVGNLINRLVGCVLVLPFLHPIANAFLRVEPHPSRIAADFHTAFNLALAILFILPLDGLAALLIRFLPERKKSSDPATPLYLDESALSTPSVALACAARETLHIGDIVEAMLRQTMPALATDDRKLVSEISRMDDAVDKLDEAVKLYVTRLTRESLSDEEGQRAMEIISFSINLEHVGDIIDKNLMGTRREEDQTQACPFSGRRNRTRSVSPGDIGQFEIRLQRLHRGRRKDGAASHCRKDATAHHRVGSDRKPFGAATGRTRGKH